MNLHNHSIQKFFKNRELNELYASISIRTFAIAMIGIFIPIYLYQLNYSFTNIFFFYAAGSFFYMISAFFAVKFASKFGVKHAMLTSMPLLVVFFILIYSLESFKIPLALLAAVLAVSTSLFWIAYHIDFSKSGDGKRMSREIGFSKVMALIFATMGPTIGGFILAVFGFPVLFILISILLITSTFPLFMSTEVHEPIKVSLKAFFHGQKLRDVLSFMGYGIEARIGTVIWPLFIFIFIFESQYVYLGLVSSLVFATSLVATFIVGRVADRKGKRFVLRTGSVFNSIIWVIKSFIVTPIQVFIADAFYGISQAMMHVPFDAINYEKARERNIPGMILQREFYFYLGSFLLFLILMLISEPIIEIFRYGGSLSSLLRLFF